MPSSAAAEVRAEVVRASFHITVAIFESVLSCGQEQKGEDLVVRGSLQRSY